MTSSRLFSLMSSSAKRVGRSSVGVSTALSLKKLGAFAVFAAAGRATGGITGAIRGGAAGRSGCGGWRVTLGNGAPGARGGEAEGGAGCQTGAAGFGAGAAGFAAGATGFGGAACGAGGAAFGAGLAAGFAAAGADGAVLT